ncbi:putative subunit of eukaryotic translation initiation factor 3 [Chloropicon primus]|uniref:Putative subunit of eukaryotic translation initiation factor 3 n=2 Tax=Chloropicon primus TaxID=1764295 RepID=A0A5B8MBW6_9CHLO|nr:putative subunit of eukaryotic translation initiation factor 3 [Chloropicon primus]|eukprot:QDZ17938.1 putative subunit of eukaryotic translation initiation factor 3 [Chloropicon primus]
MGKGKIKNKGSRSRRAPNRLEYLNTVPDVVDVHVALPGGEGVDLRCVSTDTLVDVRVALSELPETCHLTSYSLRRANEAGDVLKRDLEVVALKPNRVALAEEPYDGREAAMAQAQRFMDLFSCATLVGPVAKKKEKPTDSWLADSGKGERDLSALTPSKIKSAGAKSGGMWEEPLLHEFYSYFSFSDVPSPVEGVRVAGAPKAGGALVELEVRLRGERDPVVVRGAEGGWTSGSGGGARHGTIVALLREESEAFRRGYADLMAAFKSRNQFGNLPLGLRCNTWVVPPCLSAERAEDRRILPSEDPACMGDVGGNLSGKERDWDSEFRRSAAMPGNNPAERVARDHRLFLLWSHFVDEAVVTAITGKGGSKRFLEIDRRAEEGKLSSEMGHGGSKGSGEREASLLKGLLADENTIARDVDTLAKVTIHFNGEVIEVASARNVGDSPGQWPLGDEPALKEGIRALNVHGLREHVCHAAPWDGGEGKDLLGELLASAEFPEEDLTPPKLRWELVFSWVQHLKETEKAASLGLRRKLRLQCGSDEGEKALREAIGEDRWNQLAKLNLGLHRCTLEQLMDLANRFYSDVAIAKIVSDFESLELSPIDGQTLTDFLHSRGINMRFLGRLATMSSKNLIHIHHLCVQEMIVRSVKRIVRAILARPNELVAKASALASLFNDLFGNRKAVWDWIRRFTKARFGYEVSGNIADGLQLAILRDICKRCGVELKAKTYNFASKSPFKASDVISFFPVIKCLQFQSTDARDLLEQAKGLLDKGKLDDAVLASTSALSKIVAVCGSAQSACCANAFSLLAVVLYHTGDFVQAAVLQAKALAINEREFGLDHPDTIKSYGDLAVFYYRVGEVDLALAYVERALYLLHLCVGEQHPNTAATYINIAMMEESKGRVGLSLRYLQEALKINQRLLGGDHVQTAASYHAIAIALSLMEPPLYPLAVQHEQTCLEILDAKLGPDDLRTQDAIAWLEYFDLKAQEGEGATECNIASKGHMSVKELMDFIGEEAEEAKTKSVGGKREAKRKSKTKREKKRSKTPDSVLKEQRSGSSSGSCTNSSGEEVDEVDVLVVQQRRKDLKKKVEEPKGPVAKVEVRVEADEGGWMPVLSKRERRSSSRDSNKLQEAREVVRQVREVKKKPVVQKDKKEEERKEEVLNPHARLFHPKMNPNAKEFVPRFKLEVE